MEWRESGVVIALRKYGDSSYILEALTRDRGRVAGMLRGGARTAAALQPGTQADLTWRARLEEHLGAFRAEPRRSRLAAAMADRRALGLLTSFCALTQTFLPERQPCPEIYDGALTVLDHLDAPGADAAYARWEVLLLAELGFALDLTRCAATGAHSDLAYVSPKSGRAVSAQAGGPWAEKLLPLPRFLIDDAAPCDDVAVLQALRMTEFFLTRWVCPAFERPAPPDARLRLRRLYETAISC